MTIPQATLAGFAILALAIIVPSGLSAPQAQVHHYLLAPQAANDSVVVWRMNAATGAVSYCGLGNMTSGPSCSAWSK